jgi:hypothetical protein
MDHVDRSPARARPRPPAWLAFLAGSALVGFASLTLPWSVARVVLYNGLGLAAAVAMVVGARRHPARDRLVWYLLAAGMASFATGDLVFSVLDEVLHVAAYPSVADALFLAMYPLVISGLVVLISRRTPGGGRTNLIDAAVVALVPTVLSLTFLIGPLARAEGQGLLVRLVSVAYPAMDLAVAAVAIRLAVGMGSRPPALHLLGAGIIGLLASDTLYSWQELTAATRKAWWTSAGCSSTPRGGRRRCTPRCAG